MPIAARATPPKAHSPTRDKTLSPGRDKPSACRTFCSWCSRAGLVPTRTKVTATPTIAYLL